MKEETKPLDIESIEPLGPAVPRGSKIGDQEVALARDERVTLSPFLKEQAWASAFGAAFVRAQTHGGTAEEKARYAMGVADDAVDQLVKLWDQA